MAGKIRCALLSLLAFLCLTGTALAAEDGYIICLNPQVSLLGEDLPLPEGVEEVYGPQNLYRTADETLIAQLEEAGLLAYAEPDYPVDLLGVPNDPACADGTQWDWAAVGMSYPWEYGVSGRAPDGSRIRVGIIDSGLYAEHEELKSAHIVPGINILADEDADEADKQDVTDNVGHGTFIAGTIAAAANNGLGIAGMAPEAEILSLKCFDSKSGTVSDVVKGIYAGVDAGCRVLNMSFGVRSTQASQALTTAIDYAAEQQVIMVAAVGNAASGSSGSDPCLYPAAYDAVIGVGSIGSNKSISRFSYQNETVYITTPGGSLRSLGIASADSYQTSSGTSYATAELSAAAALALSVDPNLTAERFMELLRHSAEDLGETGYDTVYGYGLLRVDRLLAALGGGVCRVESEEGSVAAMRAIGMEPNQQANVIRVTYDERGALESVGFITLAVDENGILEAQIDLPEAGRVCLMLLDHGWRPVMGRWEETIVPAEPPDDGAGDDTTDGGTSGDGTTDGGTTDDGTTDDDTTGDGTTDDGTTDDGTTDDGTTGDGTTGDGTTGDGTTDDGTTDDGTTDDGTTGDEPSSGGDPEEPVEGG